MLQLRVMGRLGTDQLSINKNQSYASDQLSFASSVANLMSPEKVIYHNAIMFEYFESNNHLYGKSISFVIYFWVPRSIWPNKPTMLGYWLIREYSNEDYGDFLSASFGFTGEIFADFGFVGALILCLFLGIGLKRLETYNLHYRNSTQFNSVLVAMFYPYVFFAVRDPITSSTMFLMIIIIYVISGFLFNKQKYYIQS